MSRRRSISPGQMELFSIDDLSVFVERPPEKLSDRKDDSLIFSSDLTKRIRLECSFDRRWIEFEGNEKLPIVEVAIERMISWVISPHGYEVERKLEGDIIKASAIGRGMNSGNRPASIGKTFNCQGKKWVMTGSSGNIVSGYVLIEEEAFADDAYTYREIQEQYDRGRQRGDHIGEVVVYRKKRWVLVDPHLFVATLPSQNPATSLEEAKYFFDSFAQQNLGMEPKKSFSRGAEYRKLGDCWIAIPKDSSTNKDRDILSLIFLKDEKLGIYVVQRSLSRDLVE